MKKYISFFMALLFVVSACDNEDNSVGMSRLQDTIKSVEALIDQVEEGTNEGDYAPGSKTQLQAVIDWAYYILRYSGNDEAYENAVESLNQAVEVFRGNVVKAGVPLFNAGSVMRMGACGDWNFEDSFTLECKVKYTEHVLGVHHIISCEGGVGGWMLRTFDDCVQFYIMDSNGWQGCSTAALEANRWYHLAATYKKNGEVALYLDGIKVGQMSCTALVYSPTVLLQAGASFTYPTRYMRGYIQDISLWKDVRTEQEIASDVECNFSGAEEGLNAYWSLDLNVGTNITDLTGNHVATLANVVWVSKD